jgi:hypothetical protein
LNATHINNTQQKTSPETVDSGFKVNFYAKGLKATH